METQVDRQTPADRRGYVGRGHIERQRKCRDVVRVDGVEATQEGGQIHRK